MNTKGFGFMDVALGVVIVGIIASISVASINSYNRGLVILKERKVVEIDLNNIVKEAYDSSWDNFYIEREGFNLESTLSRSQYGTEVLIIEDKEKEIKLRLER